MLWMKYDYEVIINKDETYLTINIPQKYIIEKKCKKSVIIELRTKINVD